MLRVRTGPKALRAVGGSFFKLWESKEKLTGRNTPSAFTKKGTEKLQRRAGPSPLEEGGRGEGKGANSAPQKPPPPTWQTGPGSYLKTPNWRRALGPRREKVRRARGECAKPLAAQATGRGGKRRAVPVERPHKPLAAQAARRGGKRRARPGRARPSLRLPEPLRPGKTQHAGATESALLWRTRKRELHSKQGPLHIEQPGA